MVVSWVRNLNSQNSVHKLLPERIEKANPRRQLTAEESKRLNKLEGIAGKLRRGKNVQSSGVVTHYLHTNYCEAVNYWY